MVFMERKVDEKTPPIATFNDFVEICDNSCKKAKAVIMDVPYIYKFTKENKASGKNADMPLIRDIIEVQFKKDNTSMFVKKYFEDEYAEVNFLKNKFVKVDGANTFPQPVTQRRGITSQKKNGIIRVLKGVPQEKVIFWSSLAVNEDVPDLQESRDRGGMVGMEV